MLYSLDNYVGSGLGYPATINSFGINYHQEPITRSASPFFEWFYCVDGKGIFIINRQEYILEKGQIFFLKQNLPISYRGLTSNWKVHIISCVGSCLESILQSLDVTGPGLYEPLTHDFFDQHIRKLNRICKQDLPNKELALTMECYNFILDFSVKTKLIPLSFSSNEDPDLSKLHSITNYIDSHSEIPFSLNELAKEVGMSKTYMCTFFKKKMNQTIISYVNGLRISKVRRYLKDYPEKSVKEIGLMCGFNNYSYFITIFKKYMHMTPMEYRISK